MVGHWDPSNGGGHGQSGQIQPEMFSNEEKPIDLTGYDDYECEQEESYPMPEIIIDRSVRSAAIASTKSTEAESKEKAVVESNKIQGNREEGCNLTDQKTQEQVKDTGIVQADSASIKLSVVSGLDSKLTEVAKPQYQYESKIMPKLLSMIDTGCFWAQDGYGCANLFSGSSAPLGTEIGKKEVESAVESAVESVDRTTNEELNSSKDNEQSKSQNLEQGTQEQSVSSWDIQDSNSQNEASSTSVKYDAYSVDSLQGKTEQPVSPRGVSDLFHSHPQSTEEHSVTKLYDETTASQASNDTMSTREKQQLIAMLQRQKYSVYHDEMAESFANVASEDILSDLESENTNPEDETCANGEDKSHMEDPSCDSDKVLVGSQADSQPQRRRSREIETNKQSASSDVDSGSNSGVELWRRPKDIADNHVVVDSEDSQEYEVLHTKFSNSLDVKRSTHIPRDPSPIRGGLPSETSSKPKESRDPDGRVDSIVESDDESENGNECDQSDDSDAFSDSCANSVSEMTSEAGAPEVIDLTVLEEDFPNDLQAFKLSSLEEQKDSKSYIYDRSALRAEDRLAVLELMKDKEGWSS